jgi:hypothetical protein
MSAQSFEIVLARLYTDVTFRQLFLTQPQTALANYHLTELEYADLIAIDKAGLLMASHSFAHKKDKRKKPNFIAKGYRLITLWLRIKALIPFKNN